MQEGWHVRTPSANGMKNVFTRLLGLVIVVFLILVVPVFQYASGRVSPRSHNVLIVIDMQTDYDIDGNFALYGEIRSPYVGNISTLVPAINRVRSSRKWDKVVFTQDWLVPDQGFCVANTSGANLIDGLVVMHDDLFYSKNKDDAFNLIHGGHGLRHEGQHVGAASDALVDVLRSFGLTPHDTTLTVTGQMTDRCVLKTALHARSFGYDVQVVRDAVYTNEVQKPAAWGLPRPGRMVSEQLTHDVFRSTTGPGLDFALGYLRGSQVKLI